MKQKIAETPIAFSSSELAILLAWSTCAIFGPDNATLEFLDVEETYLFGTLGAKNSCAPK